MYVGNVNIARLIYYTLDQQSVSMPRKAVRKGTKVVCQLSSQTGLESCHLIMVSVEFLLYSEIG